MRWFRHLSPASKIVVLFASLNVALVLLFTLTVPPFTDVAPFSRSMFGVARGSLLQLDFAGGALRIGLAVLVVLAVLRSVDLVRPTWRSVGLSAIVLACATVLLTLYYTPILALAYLPLVLRVRWTLAGTVLACAAGLGTLQLASFSFQRVSWWRFGEASALDVLTLVLAVGALGAYLLLTFELALREARARQELGRLRDLAVRHASAQATHDERARLARELHDTLGHHLTAQRFDLQVLREAPGDAASLARALARNADAIADVRRAVSALRPEAVGADLAHDVARLAEVWAPGGRVEVAFQDVSHGLCDEGKLAVYRAAQEALTNAFKHAPGAGVTLRLAREDNETVRFEALNDAARAPGAEGQGVRGLRERARGLGGDAGLAYDGVRVRLWMILPSPS